MTEWTTAVVKLETESGFFHCQPNISIGHEFRVDLDTRREQRFVNQPTGKEFTAEIVENLDAPKGSENRLLPVEILDIA